VSQHSNITQADRITCDFQRTGRVDAVFSAVCRSLGLGALTRKTNVSRFKIGKTNDPFGRYKREYARDYAELVLLYRTASRRSAATMEKRLIEKNCELHQCKNWAGGGGGHVGKLGPYFVYVVIRFRRKPARLGMGRGDLSGPTHFVEAVARLASL